MRFLFSLSSFITAWRDYPAETKTVLGNRYVVQELIGEGSYGLTYKCIDNNSGDIVAVKQARPSKGKDARQLLTREAVILKSLKHPQIPAYKDLFTEKRHTYLVMSYVSGDTLEELIFEQKIKFSEHKCVKITIQLMEIVLYIHTKGYVHLDLRIPNVLFKNGVIHLIDFGLARRIGEPSPLKKSARTWFKDRSTLSSGAYKTSEELSDLQDIGHFMLFMLYSVFEPDADINESMERSWQEELDLSSQIREILERLLNLREPYKSSKHFMDDLRKLDLDNDTQYSSQTI